MQYGAYTNATAEAATALVNLYGGGEPPDEAAVRAALEPPFALGAAALELPAFHALALGLRRVFEAPSPVAELNQLIAAYGPVPTLVVHDREPPHFHYAPDGAPAWRSVGAGCVMALATLFTEHGPDRLGLCAAEGCDHVFVDTTRNGAQRFCSRGCANRTHVAAHRARRV